MGYFPVLKIFFLTTLSFVLAIFSTPLLTHFLFKYKIGKSIRTEETAPIYAKLHAKKSGTPTMGGILIWLVALFVALAFFYLSWIFPTPFFESMNFLTRSQTVLPLGALVASALVGLFDDWLNVRKIGPNGGGLRMRHRLLVYTAIASVAAWWFYAKLGWDVFHVPFLGTFTIGFWAIPTIIFVLVATSFSVNQTDGLDGLAGGTLLAAFAAFGAIAFTQGKYDLAAFCGVIIGGLLAFLWFNINPARFFMGDTGAMSLGVTLGIVALLTQSVLLLPIIGCIFVLETVSTIAQMLSKKIRKKKIFLSAPLHHHFEAVGWPEPKIVMRAWIIAGVAAVWGLIISLLDKTFPF